MTQNSPTPTPDEESAAPKQWPAPEAWPAPEPWQSGTVRRSEPVGEADAQQVTHTQAEEPGGEPTVVEPAAATAEGPSPESDTAGDATGPESSGARGDGPGEGSESSGGPEAGGAREDGPAEELSAWSAGGSGAAAVEGQPQAGPAEGEPPGPVEVADAEERSADAEATARGGEGWTPPVFETPARPAESAYGAAGAAVAAQAQVSGGPTVASGGWAAPGGPGPYGVPLQQPTPQPPHAPQPWPAQQQQHPGYSAAPPPQWQRYAPQRPTSVAYPQPVRFEPVPNEKFFLAILPVPRMVSGVGVGALIAGIGSILVSGAVWCFGLAGSADGWGGLVGGAFFVLSLLLGIAGVVLGILSLRQIKRSAGGVTGRGYAISGIACGGSGLALATLGLAIALALSASAP